MENLDNLATQKSWVQGSITQPFTSIITLYMHDQLGLEQAVGEIVNVVNEVYYADGDVEPTLTDLWKTTLHTSKKLPRNSPSLSPTARADHPSPKQAHLLDLVNTLRTQPDPIPLRQIDSQNPTAFLPSTLLRTESQTKAQEDDYADPYDDISLNTNTNPFLDTNRINSKQHSRNHSSQSAAAAATALSYSTLPFFLPAVQVALADEPGRKAGFSKIEVQAWENMVSFLALLARDWVLGGMEGEGKGEGGLEGVAVWMMRWGLEVRHPASFSSEISSGSRGSGEGSGGENEYEGEGDEATRLNVFVAAAGIWAVVMGEELWERKGEEVESPVGLSLDAPPPEQDRVSKRRWESWIDRFRFLSLRDDLSLSTRELASEAAAVMVRVV